MPFRVLRAAIVGGLAALVLATTIFVDIDRVRVKALAAPLEPAAGAVRIRITAADFREAILLRTPIALIARIDNRAGNAPFSVAVDGVRVCERNVASGGGRRIDCAVTGAWNPGAEHAVTIEGPPGGWALAYLELATHHGNTTGSHYLVVLPGSSTRYRAPSVGWVIAAWLLIGAASLLPVPERMPRWVRVPYWVVAGIILAEFAVCLVSPWNSNYRLVLSARTYALWMALLFAPRLWAVAQAFEPRALPDLLDRPAMRRAPPLLLAVLVLVGAGAMAWQQFVKVPRTQNHDRTARQRLYDALQPVKLANCDFKRFGEPHDGGYVLCANLLSSVQSAYSYGINGFDQWGCDVSRGLAVTLHQYDCFNLQRPACAGGQTVFHEECVGHEPNLIDGRLFDTIEDQIAKNGDAGKQLVVKMDVEGAEWDSLLQANDALFDRIEQLTIELHMDTMQDYDKFNAVVEKLKRSFFVANLHFNNFACLEGIAPFPAAVYEVLFVSKRLARLDGEERGGAPPLLTAKNHPELKDCQTLADLPQVPD